MYWKKRHMNSIIMSQRTIYVIMESYKKPIPSEKYIEKRYSRDKKGSYPYYISPIEIGLL